MSYSYSNKGKLMGQVIRVDLDSAKSVFHVCVVDNFGVRQLQSNYSRTAYLDAIINKAPQGAEIAVKACGSSHYW